MIAPWSCASPKSAAATCRCSSPALPIFSRAYYSKQPFDQSTLDIPLGSGAYKVGRFEVGRFIEFERVKDWWGADLPVSRGQNNFDIVRFEYYRDREVGFEGFTGEELSVPRGIHLAHLGDALRFSGVQGWPRQARRDPRRYAVGRAGLVHQHAARQFKDRRLREALIDAFDFEWTNKNIMYGVLRAHAFGVPEFADDGEGQAGRRRTGAARAVSRQGAGRGVRRAVMCRRSPTAPARTAAGCGVARNCCNDAGFAMKDGKRVMPNGEPFTIEFLIDEPTFQPHHHALHQKSRHARHRRHLARRRSGAIPRACRRFRFRHHRASASAFPTTPGDSLRTYFSSQAAATKGSQNLAGIADPAIDALIDIIIAAKTRAELITACKALDRVIRAGRYWVPHWYKASHWIAYWDVFGRPASKAALFARHSGDLVVRPRQGGETGTKRLSATLRLSHWLGMTY